MEAIYSQKYRSLGALVNDINEKLREFSKMTVEDVRNGSDKHYLVIHHKGTLQIMKTDEIILDNKKLRLPFKELMVIGQCLADYNQSAVGIAKDGVMTRVCYYSEDKTRISRTLINDLVRYELVDEEPYRSELQSLVNDFVKGRVGGTLIKSSKMKKIK